MATYTSKFVRAESRELEERFACTIYTSECDPLLHIRDIYLPPDSDVTLTATGYDQHVLLPVVGGVDLISPDDTQWHIPAEEVFGSFARGTEFFSARNLQPEDTINFLHIALSGAALLGERGTRGQLPLPITERNRLISGEGFAQHIHIGVYDSRVKSTLRICPGHRLAAYVVNGSWEVEDRLMAHRDALCLWDTEEVELQALSDAAIILLVEYSPK